MSIRGKIVWHDLMTTDVDGARRFYGELFAWQMKMEEGWAFIHPPGSRDHVGTVMKLEPGQPMPPCFVPYLATPALDAATAAIIEAGGKLNTGRLHAGTTGDFVIASDPTGVVFTAWQYTGTPPKAERETPPSPGEFCWDELLTSDTQTAAAFYGKVFGLGAQTMAMPGMDYTVFLRDESMSDGRPRQAAGMMKLPPGVPHPFWLAYVAVEDCDATMEKAKRLGATLPMPAFDIPNVGRFTTLLDPQMAAIGILGPTK